MTRSTFVLSLFFGHFLAIAAPIAGRAGEVNAKLQAEVAAARDSLQEHPKFKKYYEHLAATPDSLPVNGPKLALLLAAEAKTSAAIKDHTPSLLSTWQEVVRLASAGNDYKTSFPAIDALQKHPSGLLTPAAARAAKGQLLATVAEANASKPVPGEREALLELVRGLLKESLAADDAEALPPLLSADIKLSWSTTESANSLQLLLPLAQEAVNQNRVDVAKLLFDHLDALVLKTAAGKPRKDFAEAIAASRQQLTIVAEAQQAQQTLATKPLDPAANQAYGKYLLAAGQAKESLTYLALGADPEWKQLAAKSLEAKTAADKVALADRWQATAKDAGGKEIARLFYQEALADKSLVGIPRAAAEEKLKELGAAPTVVKPAIAAIANRSLPLNEWTELLPLIDFDQDLVRGFFHQGPGNSVIMDKSPWGRFRLPVLLEDCSYDLAVEITPGTPAQEVHLVLPVGKQSVTLIVDGTKDNQHTYFDMPKAMNHKGNLLLPDQAYRYDVTVRLRGDRAEVAFSLNGKYIVSHEGPTADFKPHRGFVLKTHNQPGLAGYESNAVFTRCQVRPISGVAAIGRDVALLQPIPASVLALKATSLTTLRPLSTKVTKNYYGVNNVPGPQHAPIVGGVLCREYLFAHAPSSLTYAVPANGKYFTAIAYSALSGSVKFVVRFDGKDTFATQSGSVLPVVVEIPAGAKEMQLICDSLGDSGADHSFWCFPAFR
ncbi:NPCBM/NEW2 domain-containing protein [Anatilimnocola sp. NA78]|uniref:NPCBM/NEW2 domain-containing protein n=1 Tax=Anatilimnocola sp. NA78 TaxID=3415683 RepID=UPI003CE57783